MKKLSIMVTTDEINQYLVDVRKSPLVTPERENQIFKRLQNQEITKEEKEKLYDELVVGNLRFVISVAKQYQNQGMDLLDLISEGNIGLMKAARRFDPTKDFKFISYAVWWIKQTIKASLNENARTIRLPSNLVQEAQKQKREEMSEEDHYFIQDGDDIVFSPTLPYCIGIYNEINEDGDQLIDIIPNKNSPNPEEQSFNSKDEIRKRVNSLLHVLDDRERIIIEKYYGLNGGESNLDDLGEEFQCTKERVRQLRDKAIKKMRNESFDLLNYL